MDRRERRADFPGKTEIVEAGDREFLRDRNSLRARLDQGACRKNIVPADYCCRPLVSSARIYQCLQGFAGSCVRIRSLNDLRIRKLQSIRFKPRPGAGYALGSPIICLGDAGDRQFGLA